MKKLTLGEYTQIAEIIGAIAIVISLIFVGLEIRQNTSQSKVESIQTTHTFFTYVNDLFVNEDTAQLMLEAVNDFDTMKQIQKVRFDGVMANISSGYELAREYYK